MSLIKCSECQKDISDEAISCPFCGKPNKIEKIHTIELTSKKWKIVKIISVLLIFIGVLIGFSGESKGGDAVTGFGVFVVFLGLIMFIVGKIGAWWSNR